MAAGTDRRRRTLDEDGTFGADARWPGEPAPGAAEPADPPGVPAGPDAVPAGAAGQDPHADGPPRGEAGERAGRGALAVDPVTRLQHALDLAYRHLGHRDRTVVEVRRHLERKRVEPATIDEAIEALLEQGYLDDARYARQFADDRRLLDAWGADRIERKLAAAGVARQHVEAALAAQDAAGELDAACALLRRRFPTPPADDRARERALGVLVRKGYGLDLAYEAVRAYAREAG
jgi:regulatory protein